MPRNMLLIYGTVVSVYSVEGFLVTVFGPYLESQHLDHGIIGTIIGIFFIISLISRLPAGMIYRKQTVRQIMAVSLAVMAVTMFLYPHTGNALLLTTLRVLHGLTFGVATTLNMAMFFELRPTDFDRGRAMGIFAASLAIGKMIGRLVSGVIVDFWGYKVSFAAASLFPFIAVFLTIFIVFDQTADVEKAEGVATVNAEHRSDGAKRRFNWTDWWQQAVHIVRFMRDPIVLMPAIMAFSLNFLHTMFDGFFPLLGVAIGLSLSTVGLYGGLNNFIGVFSRLLTGELGRIFSPALLSHVGIAFSALLIFFLPSARNPYVLLALVMGLAIGRAIVTVTAAIEVMKVRKERSGLASGIFNSGKDLGAFAGPYAAGIISYNIGLEGMFRVLPVGLLIVYSLIMIWVHIESRRSTPTGHAAET